jgi:S1-C subfamily serine protease
MQPQNIGHIGDALHAGLVQSSYFSMDTAKLPAGMGSGFIWDDQGHIVTNYHVIKDAAEVQVTLIDQSVWPAKVRPQPCTMSVSTSSQ